MKQIVLNAFEDANLQVSIVALEILQEWTFLFDLDEIKKSYLPFVERILVQGVSSSIGYVLRLHLARL